MPAAFRISQRTRVGQAVRPWLVPLTALLACGRTPGPPPGLEVDVARYVARVEQWAVVERNVSAAAARLFRSHFLDDDLAIAVTDELAASIDAHVAALAAYAPETAEVGRIHSRYARAWGRLREGFRLINRGMRENDAKLLAQGRRRIEVWQEEMLNVAASLQQLVEEVRLEDTKAALSAPRPRGSPDRPASHRHRHARQNERTNAA